MLVSVLLCAACGGTQASPKEYVLHGVVESVDVPHGSAMIRGEKIPGFMEAMTMEYPVRDKDELARLHPGEKFVATVYARESDYWLGKIRETK